MNEHIFDIIAYLLPFIIAFIFGLKPVSGFFKSRRSKLLKQIVELVYLAVANMKRQYEKANGRKLSANDVRRQFEKLIIDEMKNHGVKPTPARLEQAKLMAEAEHVKNKIRKGEY